MASRPDATGDRRRRRRAATAAVLAVALLLLLFGVRSGRSGHGTPPEPEPADPGARGGSAGPSPQGPARPTPHPLDTAALARGAPPAIREMPPPRPDEKFAYPPWSQPLTEGVDPATTVAEDNPVDAKSGIHVVLGPRKQVVHPPDAVVLDMKVLNRLGAAMPVGSPIARFRADRTNTDTGPWYEVPFEDDGSHAYVATFRPTPDQQTALYAGGEHVFVEAKFDAPDGLGLRRYPMVVLYTREPHATPSGKYADRVASGSLVIDVGVTVTQAGHYRAIGSLYAGDGERALAFATNTVALDAGDGTLPLTFFGKILHDSGIDGPYELRYLMLFEVVKPGEEIPGDTVDPACTTAAYQAKRFAPDAYQAPPPDYTVVDMNSPSQQDKPPPLFAEDSRKGSRAVPNPPITSGQGPPAK